MLDEQNDNNRRRLLEPMAIGPSHLNATITTPTPTIVDLETIIGPVRDSNSIVILMTIVYVAILITGVTGNLITCLVIAKKRYMHTATNYYLFSLAVSDLLLLILGLPHDLVLVWHKYPYVFGESFCIVRGLSSELSTNASILTIIAFTIERYIAICHPLRSHTTLKLSRVIKTIVIIWIISALCALPISYQFGIVYVLNDQQQPYSGSDQCAVKSLLFDYIFEVATMVFFVIPICIITVLYILIGIKLRASSKSVHQQHSNLQNLNSKPNMNRSNSKKSSKENNPFRAPSFQQLRTNSNRFGSQRSNLDQHHHHHHHHNQPNHHLQPKHTTSLHSLFVTDRNRERIINDHSLTRECYDGDDDDRNTAIALGTISVTNVSESGCGGVNGDRIGDGKMISRTISDQKYSDMKNDLNSSSSNRWKARKNFSISIRRQNASRRAVIKMLVAVVIAFFFCYSPFHAQRVMAIVMARNDVSEENFVQIFTLLTHISGITYYLSSTINPILYQIMSKKFQLAFRETIPCLNRKHSNDSQPFQPQQKQQHQTKPMNLNLENRYDRDADLALSTISNQTQLSQQSEKNFF
ncbi:hypothetical protein NH340_JMT01644 [Sarcoptes scabiei]|nr:hypothetical protein NH340_JMT01644 [Sarcoptes scabiei]